MPSEQPQTSRPSTPDPRLGDGGDYYHPGRYSIRFPEIALSAQFLLAADKVAPEVRRVLREEVFPLVPEVCNLRRLSDPDAIAAIYEEGWVPPPPGNDEANSKFPGDDPILAVWLALRSWARTFRLFSPHLMTVSVEALLDWHRGRGLWGHEPPRDRWGIEVEFLGRGWSARPPKERDGVMRIRNTRASLFPFRAEITGRWLPRMETEGAFKTMMRTEFERELSAYVGDAKRYLELRGYRRVPRKTAAHHLDWLVQYQVSQLTHEAIADRWALEHPRLQSPLTGDAVAKAVRATARAISLQLRAST